MKILFDHQIFYQLYGGASKYFTMLLENLSKDEWETTTLFSCNEYVKAKGLFKTYPYIFRGQARLSDTINKPYTNYCLRNGNFDVFHQTNFGTYCLKSLGDKPMVTTFHDINLSTIDPHPEIVKRQRISLERANAIICVSENTKQDMLRIFDIDEHKVHVIHHGIELPNLDKISNKRIFDYPYILFVGRRSEYKNFKGFIKAFSLFHKQYPDINVICTSSAFTASEIELFKGLSIMDCMKHISAYESTMLKLYRDALFFIFPSFYEGFGMPILEAWSCHCPVILSNTSCFPEIAQDAGVYFDPNNIDEIYDQMIKLASDSELKINLITKGDERVKRFSWKKCADEHMKVYEDL